MAPVDSRDYIGLLSGIYYSVLVRNTMWLVNSPSKHEILTQCWSDAGQMLAHRLRHWPSIKPALVKRPALVVTAGGEYQPTPTQCLVNVGPASSVLGSIYSALVSTSCWRYRHDALYQSWVIVGLRSVYQSWVNVGLRSVTLAHIQRYTKHHPVIY